MRRAAVAGLGTTLAAALVTGVSPPDARSHTDSVSSPTRGWVRVNQQGYLPGEPKQARLMTTHPVHGARFRVTDSSGAVVLRGPVPGRSTGAWSSRFPTVYRLDLSAMREPGRYRISTRGAGNARSP